METKFMTRDDVKSYIQKNCIWRANPDTQYEKYIPKGKLYAAAPGFYNSWLVMMRRLTHNPVMLNFVAEQIYSEIKDFDIQLCGLETSSIPIISAIQIKAINDGKHFNSFTVRKERKKYGLFNLFDGIPNRLPFLTIDDFTNTGSSVRTVCDASLYEYNLDSFPMAYSILRNDKNHENVYFNAVKIELKSLFKCSEFDFDYNPEEYWLPSDCDKSLNKRPDYI